MKDRITRRELIEKLALASMTTILPGGHALGEKAGDSGAAASGLQCHIFSKHLQFLNYREMTNAAAEMGFDGVDLTVRPNGHVLPERVEEDLPAAVEALKSAGFSPTLITTAITSVTQAHSEKVLKAAAEQRFKYYRLGYYRYPKAKPIPESLAGFREDVRKLSLLSGKLGIRGAYQNHAGLHVGAAIWEIWEILKDVEQDFIGCQYDIRHASVEGGKSWATGLRLIAPRINTIVLKDYKWAKIHGKWSLMNVPIGEGMVDFIQYFSLLKKYKINVPVSLHCEYDLGGAEHGKSKISVSQKTVMRAMQKDLALIRSMWEAAV